MLFKAKVLIRLVSTLLSVQSNISKTEMEASEKEPERIRVQEIQGTDLSKASFAESVESGHSSHSDTAQIASKLGIVAPSLRMDSQCKYAAVARGDASIYMRIPVSETYQENIWVLFSINLELIFNIYI